MSPKGYIVSLSLGGAAVGLACWISAGAAVAPAAGKARTVAAIRSRPAVAVQAPAPAPEVSRRAETPRIPAVESPRRSQASLPLSTAELTARAARVEQEANHDLRRLVTLLNLSEAQQDQVFQTLARHSPSWSPGMLALPAAGGELAPGGKRSLATSPGLYSVTPAPEVKAPPTPANPEATEAPVQVTDPMMDEIMALLSPEQQDTLIQAELDRAAWWAEILEQITPPDEIPALDTAVPPPVPGDSTAYEGADILE